MSPISFVVPGRPIPKERPRATKTGRMITPKKTRTAEKAIGGLARAAMRGRNPMTCAIRLNIVFVFAIPSGWNKSTRNAALEGRVWHVTPADLDNMTKLVSDACNEVVWADDGQVAIITVGKRYGSPERSEVTISAIEQADDAITPGQRKLTADMDTGRWHVAKAERAARRKLRR